MYGILISTQGQSAHPKMSPRSWLCYQTYLERSRQSGECELCWGNTVRRQSVYTAVGVLRVPRHGTDRDGTEE